MSGPTFLDEGSYVEYQAPYVGCRYFIVTKEGFPAFVVYCIKDLRSLLALSRTFLSAWVLVHIPPHSTEIDMCSEYGMEHARDAIKGMINTRFMKYHFFLSYRNSIHNHHAERMFLEIESCSFNVFFDSRKLSGGSILSSQLIQNLIRSQVFVPLVSISVMQSILNNVLETPMEVDYLFLEWITALALMECNLRDFPAFFSSSSTSSSPKGLLPYPIMKIWPIVFIDDMEFMSSYRVFKATKAEVLNLVPATTMLKVQEYWETFITPVYSSLIFPFSVDLTVGDIFDKMIGNYRYSLVKEGDTIDYHSFIKNELSIVLRK